MKGFVSRFLFLATLVVSCFVSFGCETSVGDRATFVALLMAAGECAHCPESNRPVGARSDLQASRWLRRDLDLSLGDLSAEVTAGARRLPRQLHHSKDASLFQQLFLATSDGMLLR